MKVKLPRVLKVILAGYALPLDRHQGVDHGARVLKNSLRLATKTGATVDVVSLLVVLQDSQW